MCEEAMLVAAVELDLMVELVELVAVLVLPVCAVLLVPADDDDSTVPLLLLLLDEPPPLVEQAQARTINA